MKEQIVSYEIAMVIKNKGFNVRTEYSYFDYHDVEFDFDDMGHIYEVGVDYKFGELELSNVYYQDIESQYYAPTQSLLQKWLREVHNIHVYVSYEFDSYRSYVVVNNVVEYSSSVGALSYEQVLEVALTEAVERCL